MARRRGFEPLTPRFVVWCSIQLSYRRLEEEPGTRNRSNPALQGVPGWRSGGTFIGPGRPHDPNTAEDTPPKMQASRSRTGEGSGPAAMDRRFSSRCFLLPVPVRIVSIPGEWRQNR
jgi:hypothetical protein